MSQQQLIESVSKLAQHFEIDTEFLSEKTGIPILALRNQLSAVSERQSAVSNQPKAVSQKSKTQKQLGGAGVGK